MFLYSECFLHFGPSLFFKKKQFVALHWNSKEKVKFSPRMIQPKRDMRTFLFAPLRAALTVEAAMVLPVFLCVMIATMQYGNVMGTAAKFGASMADTGKKLAAAAYVSRYGGDLKDAPELAAAALSAAYAQRRALSQAGDVSSVKNVNMLLSSFLQKEETIDLVMTYQIRSPLGIVKLPWHFFIQRARVRAWTGRRTESGSGEQDGEAAEEFVYVTETGSVYHEDPDCTHLKLSVKGAEASELPSLRNRHGEIYHACERCGGISADGRVYITKEGNRYHNSLSCSGLKRTVRRASREELGSMRACAKCGRR